MRCPICEGQGELLEFSLPEVGSYSRPCGMCGGDGTINIIAMISYWFWNTVPDFFVEWYIDQMWKRRKPQ